MEAWENSRRFSKSTFRNFCLCIFIYIYIYIYIYTNIEENLLTFAWRNLLRNAVFLKHGISFEQDSIELNSSLKDANFHQFTQKLYLQSFPRYLTKYDPHFREWFSPLQQNTMKTKYGSNVFFENYLHLYQNFIEIGDRHFGIFPRWKYYSLTGLRDRIV